MAVSKYSSEFQGTLVPEYKTHIEVRSIQYCFKALLQVYFEKMDAATEKQALVRFGDLTYQSLIALTTASSAYFPVHVTYVNDTAFSDEKEPIKPVSQDHNCEIRGNECLEAMIRIDSNQNESPKIGYIQFTQTSHKGHIIARIDQFAAGLLSRPPRDVGFKNLMGRPNKEIELYLIHKMEPHSINEISVSFTFHHFHAIDPRGPIESRVIRLAVSSLGHVKSFLGAFFTGLGFMASSATALYENSIQGQTLNTQLTQLLSGQITGMSELEKVGKQCTTIHYFLAKDHSSDEIEFRNSKLVTVGKIAGNVLRGMIFTTVEAAGTALSLRYLLSPLPGASNVHH